MIYLDNAASRPILKEALDVLESSLREDFSNPSALHKLGKEISKKIASSRADFLKLLNSNGDYELIFTSSATESNNLAIFSVKLGLGDEVIIQAGAHPSLINPIMQLKSSGINVIETNEFEHERFNSLLNSKTKLVVLTQVHNLSGQLLDIEALSKIVKNFNSKIAIHVDSVQGFSKHEIDVKKWDIDSLSLSSHKIGGPKGIAALVFKKSFRITPLMFGGGQEKGLRSSTESAPLILSFLKASQILLEDRLNHINKVNDFKNYVIDFFKRGVEAVEFPFFEIETTPYILTIIVNGISSDIIIRHLEQKNIFVSSSSACSSKIKGENSQFKALGIDLKKHKFVIRVSFSEKNTSFEIEKFCTQFKSIYESLSSLFVK